jgi:hypothetical protein
MLGHLHPRGLGVQHQYLACRNVGKVVDPILEQPVAAANTGNEDDVLAHRAIMDLFASLSTQNDHVVDPCGGLSVGSGGLSLDGLDADSFPLPCIEIQ